jgi:hypothetical protein
VEPGGPVPRCALARGSHIPGVWNGSLSLWKRDPGVREAIKRIDILASKRMFQVFFSDHLVSENKNHPVLI